MVSTWLDEQHIGGRGMAKLSEELEKFRTWNQLERIGDELERIRDPRGFAERRDIASRLLGRAVLIITQMAFSCWFAWKVLGQTQDQIRGNAGPHLLTWLGTFVVLFPLIFLLGKASGKLLGGYDEGGFWHGYTVGLFLFVMGWIIYGTISGVAGMFQ